MEVETTLAETIDTAGENAKYDAACKRLLSETGAQYLPWERNFYSCS